MIFPILPAGEIGVIKDTPGHELPLTAWTESNNIRFKDGYALSFSGQVRGFSQPANTPLHFFPFQTPTSYYWLVATATKAYVWDGAAYNNATRQAALVDVDYLATPDSGWVGDSFGGVPILTNPQDEPQFLLPAGSGVRLRNFSSITDWPTTLRARSVRAFRQYLVALDLNKAGVRYPQTVKWSHPAAPGNIPSVWDETDPSKDAGEFELAASGGQVVDAVPLRDSLIIYKEDNCHSMQYIGGQAIMRFTRLFDQVGLLVRRCAVEFMSGQHFVFSVGDIVLHNGQEARSLLNRRVRNYVYSTLSDVYYTRSFVAINKAQKEVWACYPTTGHEWPNRALVWNWEANTITFRDLPGASWAETGLVSAIGNARIWDTLTGSQWKWNDQANMKWDERAYNLMRPGFLLGAVGPELYEADFSTGFAGAPMTCLLERDGLGVPLKVDAPPDFSTVKMLRRLWPRITGSAGTQIQVQVGAKLDLGMATVWDPPVAYTIGQTQPIDVRSVGRLHSVRFSSVGISAPWKLYGYELDIVPQGTR